MVNLREKLREKMNPTFHYPVPAGVFNRISTGNTYVFNKTVWKTFRAVKSVIFFHNHLHFPPDCDII